MPTHLRCHACNFVARNGQLYGFRLSPAGNVLCPKCSGYMDAEYERQPTIVVTMLGPAPTVPMPETFASFVAALDMTGL